MIIISSKEFKDKSGKYLSMGKPGKIDKLMLYL